MNEQYVEQKDQGYWVSYSRVSLESVIFPFWAAFLQRQLLPNAFPFYRWSRSMALSHITWAIGVKSIYI